MHACHACKARTACSSTQAWGAVCMHLVRQGASFTLPRRTCMPACNMYTYIASGPSSELELPAEASLSLLPAPLPSSLFACAICAAVRADAVTAASRRGLPVLPPPLVSSRASGCLLRLLRGWSSGSLSPLPSPDSLLDLRSQTSNGLSVAATS